MNRSLILKGNFISTPTPDSLEVHGNSYLVCEDGRVEGIYPVIPDKFKDYTVHDYGDKLVIPGFVDLHLHAAQFLQCGVGMTKKLLSWLEDYTFELEEEFKSRAFARKAYNLFADKLVRCGTLSSCIFASSSTQGTEELFEVLKTRGIAAYVGKVDMDTNAPDYIVESTLKSLEGTAYLIERYKSERLVKPIITPRFAPTSTPELLEGLGDLALQYNLPVQSHLSENLDEIQWVKKIFKGADNYSDVYFKKNLFGQTKTIMAHAVHLDDDEKSLVKRMNLTLVHCPDSNINVRSGIMPVRTLLDLGIKVGLGSDIAGGHKIAMNEAMVRAIQLSKIMNMMDENLNPLSFSEAFYMGTKAGGSFFGNTGSFEEGCYFDALVIEDDPMTAERYSLEDRLEKFIHVGDDRNILARYVQGKKLSIEQ